MRYLYLLFFLLLGLHSHFVFSQDDPIPNCPGFKETVCSLTQSCAGFGSEWNQINLIPNCSVSYRTAKITVCALISTCECPSGFILNTIQDSSGRNVTSCIPDDTSDTPGECVLPDVKNIDTGACEPKTDCQYPLLYDFYSNACFSNPYNCAVGATANPLIPGTCISTVPTSCPVGWVLSSDLLNCLPANSSASSIGADSSSPSVTSATPTSATNTSTPSSTPSNTGDGSGTGTGTGTGTGSGSGTGTGTGTATGSSASSVAPGGGEGSGEGSGGSGECDPTSSTYLDCISRQSGDDGDGLDDVNQQDYGLNIGDRLQQARDDYTDRLNQIQDDFSQSMAVSLGAGSGSLPTNTVTLFGQSVEMGIYARRDFFDAIRWAFLAVASVISLYIVLSK